MTVKKCDRCGATYEENKFKADFDSFDEKHPILGGFVYAKANSNVLCRNHRIYLCDNCLEDLEDWLEDPEEHIKGKCKEYVQARLKDRCCCGDVWKAPAPGPYYPPSEDADCH